MVIVKKRILSLIMLICLTTACLCMTACGRDRNDRNKPEQVVTLYNNSWIMEKYMKAIQDYDHVIYEQVYFDWGGRSIGPTEYRFRGIVYLTDEEAARLLNDYEWDQTDAPEFEFEKVDAGSVGEGPWCSCQEFNIDNYPAVIVNYSVFDGEKLVFDISQS